MQNLSIKAVLVFACLVFFSLQNDYTITCPSGTTRKDNPDKTPTANGCGGSDSQRQIDKLLNPYRSTVTPCCNAHDICYNTCYTDDDSKIKSIFNDCNSEFKTCLYDRCSDLKSSIKRLSCKAEAKLLYEAVSNYGASYFKSDQKFACICSWSSFKRIIFILSYHSQ